jgi:Zn-dependent peptidase ImmA (M78 family)
MAKKRGTPFEVNSEFIVWSIDSSGWDKEELRQKLKINKEVFSSWLKGTARINLKHLKDLAKRTRRPLASFFLPEIPKEKPLPKDYRLHPEQEGKFNKKTIFAVRRARELQEILKDLMNSLYENRKKTLKKRTLKESPILVAKELRSFFGLTEEKQTKFRESYSFKNFLREKLEENNIFVFQISMPEEDARGFALSDSFPNAITINSKDSIEARIFTLMHEVGHILLGNTGISIPDFNNKNSVEKWCNEFASNFLLPKKIARRIFEENDKNLTKTTTLKTLSRKYKVSKNMLLYNMIKLKFITFDDYKEVLNRYKKDAEKKEKEGERLIEEMKRRGEKIQKGGRIPTEIARLSELGNRFISLVAENTQKNNITYSDALSYLSIKSKNFNKLMKKI